MNVTLSSEALNLLRERRIALAHEIQLRQRAGVAFDDLKMQLLKNEVSILQAFPPGSLRTLTRAQRVNKVNTKLAHRVGRRSASYY
jgi:hypothetical protein